MTQTKDIANALVKSPLKHFKLTVKTLGFFLGFLLRSLPLASNDSDSMESAGVLGDESVLPVGVYIEPESR